MSEIVSLFNEFVRRVVRGRYPTSFLAAVAVLGMIVTFILLDLIGPGLFASAGQKLLYMVVALSLLTTVLVMQTYFRTLSAHPRALSIALVGPTGAGKTVYLTVLYSQLEAKNIKGLSFAPYGSQTVERVGKHLTMMRTGQFPPATSREEHVRYEAVASYGSGFRARRYRIQILDYAGEHLNQFDASSDQWVHRSEFFEYVVKSDALLMMIDCERVLRLGIWQSEDPIPHLENQLVAMLHTFIEKRTDDPTDPFGVPVGLILSKSDLLSERDEKHALSQLSRLVSVCERRCRYFKVFFVSSIGEPPEWDNRKDTLVPPAVLHPAGVTEPLLWILGR